MALTCSFSELLAVFVPSPTAQLMVFVPKAKDWPGGGV